NVEDGVLPYLSPFFERNALKAAGISSVPAEWRRGSLALFAKVRACRVTRTKSRLAGDDDWTVYPFDGVEIRVREGSSTPTVFADPTLVAVASSDVLPSVSRRDPRRSIASVWTSGNRVFACQGLKVLHEILTALCAGSSPNEAVASRLGRSLSADEVDLVT